MSVPKSEHKVFIYTDDYNKLCAEVYHHQHIETGGNLFGLWTTSGSAVIHVVLGPGQGCRRTTTSFHQDIEYMKRVGGFVNEGYMLCHIGEWHSHHRLSLNKPSSGDEQTVRRNFPQGMLKFLVIIANIVDGGDRIVLSPYFFTDGGTRYEKAEYEVLKSNSPFSSDVRIVEQIEVGKEGNKDTLVEITNQRETSSRAINPRDTGSNHNGSTSPAYSQTAHGINPSASDLNADPNASGSNARGDTEEPMDTSDVVFQYPLPKEKNRRSVGPSMSTSQSVSSPSSPTAQNRNTILHPPKERLSSFPPVASPSSASPPVASPSSQTAPHQSAILHQPKTYNRSTSAPGNTTSTSQPSSSPPSQTAPNQNENDVDDTEILLKNIHDELRKWFGNKPEAKFEFKSPKQATGGAVIEIKFKHNDRFWMVRFPGDFPAAPAKLFCDRLESWLDRSECAQRHTVKPLTNHVNILLSIRKKCCSFFCTFCEKIKEESLTKSATTSTADKKGGQDARREDIMRELSNNIEITLASWLTLNDEAQGDGGHKITFEHYNVKWAIKLPAEFPDKPAKISKQTSRYAYGSAEMKAITTVKVSNAKQEEKPFVSSDLIMLAIKSNCECWKCKYGEN